MRPTVFVCIGSDRSTGDALGPLVGTKLTKTLRILPPCFVYGTLEEPVHAVNLNNVIKEITDDYHNPLVIAVDACLGELENVGMLTIAEGSLQPGLGVRKQLPAVGEIYVSGTVNVGGFLEHLVLQNTRLALTMKMADLIASIIRRGYKLTALQTSTGKIK